MEYIDLGPLKVSRFILGSNPFSGFSHQSPQMDLAMKHYFTSERIKQTIREAESLGVDTLVGRADHPIIRLLMEYWDEGGSIQWLAQTCPEIADYRTCIRRVVEGGAKACHLHGGVMDFLFAQGRMNEVPPVVKMFRDSGLLVGMAAHNPQVIEWAESNLDMDYYMCSYYNSAHRDKKAEHVSGMSEWFVDEDRRTMTSLVKRLSRPVIHYKVMAAGRNDPAEAFDYAAANMRSTDAVCVGIFAKDKPVMLNQNVNLLEESLERFKRIQ